MTSETTQLPLPRSVLVVGDEEYERISHTPAAVDSLQDSEAMIIPYSSTPIANRPLVESVRDLIRSADQLASDALLIKHPYERDAYVHADDSIQTFAVAKYHHLAVVASLLGATSMSIQKTAVEKSDQSLRGRLSLGVKGFGAKGRAAAEIRSALEEQLQFNTVFPGSAPDRDEALTYIREHALAADKTFTSLVALRNDRNPVREYTLVLNATKEAELNIRAALKISAAVPKVLEASGDFVMTARTISDVKIHTLIEFDV